MTAARHRWGAKGARDAWRRKAPLKAWRRFCRRTRRNESKMRRKTRQIHDSRQNMVLAMKLEGGHQDPTSASYVTRDGQRIGWTKVKRSGMDTSRIDHGPPR